VRGNQGKKRIPEGKRPCQKKTQVKKIRRQKEKSCFKRKGKGDIIKKELRTGERKQVHFTSATGDEGWGNMRGWQARR